MKPTITSVLCCLFFIIGRAQSADEKQVREILTNQEKAWNQGDLEKFMIGYQESDSMMFIGKNGVTYGYRQTLERYKSGYGDTSKMGKFTSTVLHVNRISHDAYFVVGKWHLQRSIGDVEGHYSLLFRKIKGKWVIVADHSS